MATIDYSGKVAYMYDSASDTWYAISGAVNTAASYVWTGTQDFGATVVFEDVVKSKAGVNNFLNPSARDLAIPSPQNGVVVFIRNDADGNVLNEIQYYYNGAWRSANDSISRLDKTANHTLELSDAGKTIFVTSSSDVEITIPLNSSVPFAINQKIEIIRNGSGNVSITGPVGVTINSKNSNKKIAARYSGAILTKYDTNTWILIGDLTA